MDEDPNAKNTFVENQKVQESVPVESYQREIRSALLICGGLFALFTFGIAILEVAPKEMVDVVRPYLDEVAVIILAVFVFRDFLKPRRKDKTPKS